MTFLAWRKVESEDGDEKKMDDTPMDEEAKRELDRERLRVAEEQVSKYLANVNFENSWIDDLEDIPFPNEVREQRPKETFTTTAPARQMTPKQTLVDRKLTSPRQSRSEMMTLGDGEKSREKNNTVTVNINFRLSVDREVEIIPVKLYRGPM